MRSRSKRQAAVRIAKRFLQLRLAKDLPKDVERYVKEVKRDNPGYDDAKAWATAWSIYCKNNSPDSPHCKKPKGDYFPGKKATSWQLSPEDLQNQVNAVVRRLSQSKPELGVPLRGLVADPQAIRKVQEMGLVEAERGVLYIKEPAFSRYLSKVGKRAAISNQDMKRAMQLLVGPGFGAPGLTMKEASAWLVKDGMSPQEAFLAVKAGAQLARGQGIEVRASGQVQIFDDPAENTAAMKVLKYMLYQGPEGTPVLYEEIAPMLKGHRNLWGELTAKGFVDSRRMEGEAMALLHKRRPNDWKLLGIRG